MYTEGPSLYLYRHIYTIQYTTECLYAYSVMPTSFSTASFVKHPSLSKFIKWKIFLTGNAQFTKKIYVVLEDYNVWRKKGNFSFSLYVHGGKRAGVVCCCWINCKIVCRGYVYSYFSACNIIVLCHQCQCQHYSDLCRLQSNYIHYIIK